MENRENRLLTLPEAGEILGLSPSTLRKWHAQGILRVVKLGRSVRMRISDVENLIEEGFSTGKLEKTSR
ncbi:helix-turn-helix transcriptional regulator [Nitrospinota bacterium]